MHRPHTLTIFPCAECVISGSCLRRLSRPLVAEKQRRQSSKRPRNVRNCNNFTKNALKMRLFTPKSGINRVEDLAKKVRDRTGLQLLCRLYTLTQVFVRLSLFGVMFAASFACPGIAGEASERGRRPLFQSSGGHTTASSRILFLRKKVCKKPITIALQTSHAGSSVRLLGPVWGHVCCIVRLANPLKTGFSR